MDLASKTVLELRKLAKEHNIKLSAGINKSEIIQRLEEALASSEEESTVQLNMLSDYASDLSGKMPDADESDVAKNMQDLDTEDSDSETDSADNQEDEEEEEEAELPFEGKPRPPLYASPIPSIPTIPTIPSIPSIPTPSASSGSAQEGSQARTPSKAGQPHYRSSWHNAQSSSQGKFSPSARQTPANWNTAPTRPQSEPPRSSFGPASNSFGPRFGPQSSGFGPQVSGFGPQQNTGFGPQSVSEVPAAPAQDQPKDEDASTHASFTPPTGKPYEQRAATRPAPARPFAGESRPSFPARSFSQEGQSAWREPVDLPSIEDLITPAECSEASGVLEVLPDGYGFLRSDSLLPSSHDLYVASSIIRRYELRSGDYVEGRIRPARDGDKYNALLYVNTINGTEADQLSGRTSFEDLTPVYSDRRLNLDDCRHADVRLIDLLAPIGFGNRALFLFPPDCGKRQLLAHLTDSLVTLNENTNVILLLLDFPPEEVTAIRDEVSCPVLASTFDQTPDTQMRLIDLAQERAHRLAESGKDVILIVDSLTRLVKTYAAASQSNRQSASIINPSALFRAKKLFGAARCAREGGSLTVIATMDIESGVKLDDSIVEEFRANTNAEIYMDSSIARMGIYPPVHYQRTRSHRTELLLDDKEQEGLKALRNLLSSGSPANAVTQLLGLIDKVAHNKDVLMKIINWSALMAGRHN